MFLPRTKIRLFYVAFGVTFGFSAFMLAASAVKAQNFLFGKDGSGNYSIKAVLTPGTTPFPIMQLNTSGGLTVATMNASNISSGTFGSNTGGGNFSFPGNVGFGTTNPLYKLDVQSGQINTSGGLCIAGDCKTAWSQVISQWTTSGNNIYYNTGNVGIGTTSPGYPLTIAGQNIMVQGYASLSRMYSGGDAVFGHNVYADTASRVLKQTNTGYYGAWIRMYYNNGITFGTSTAAGTAGDTVSDPIGTTNERMIITNAGNVGIGTTSPGSRLDVNQPNDYVVNMAVTNTNSVLRTSYNSKNSAGTNYMGEIDWRHDLGAGSGFLLQGTGAQGAITQLSVMAAGVGIGTHNPYNALHVIGNIGATGWVGAGCEVNCESSGGYAILYPSGYLSLNGYAIQSPQTSYGTVAFTSALNGYYGSLYGTGTSHANVMYDGSGNGGIYYQNWGWSQYYLTSTRHMNINTSTDLGYALGVSGSIRATTGILADDWLEGNRIYSLAGDITQYGGSSYAFRSYYTNGSNNYASSLNWYGLQLGNNGGNYIVGGRTNYGGSLAFYTNNTTDFPSINGTWAMTLDTSGYTTLRRMYINGGSGMNLRGSSNGRDNYLDIFNDSVVYGVDRTGIRLCANSDCSYGHYIYTQPNSNLVISSIGSNNGLVVSTGGVQAAGDIYSYGYSAGGPNGNLWLATTDNSLPGYGSNNYPTLKTGYSYMYFSAGWAFSAYMDSGGGWHPVSTKERKTNFKDIDYSEILTKIDQMPVQQWNYKTDDSSIKHIGPFAEDFHSLFNLGEKTDTALKTINYTDEIGIALAGIKGLSQNSKDQQKQIDVLQEKNKKIEDLGAKIDQLQKEVEELKKKL